MLLILIPIAVVMLAVIGYFAFSKKSSKPLRITAFVALSFILVSIAICLLVIFGVFSTTGKNGQLVKDLPETPVIQANSNPVVLIIIVVVLLVVFGIILASFVRDQRRRKQAAEKGE
jgi:uncharacterized protein YneF (UPF0154 family)